MRDLQAELEASWAVLRPVVFPRWRSWNTWRVSATMPVGETRWRGVCVPKTRTLHVNLFEGMQPHERDSTLIHEAIHAAVCMDHGKRFKARMLAASHSVRAAGMVALADELFEQWRSHMSGGIKFGARDIYACARDIIESTPGISYDGMCEELAECWPYAPDEFEMHFRRLRPVHSQGARRGRRTEAGATAGRPT